MERDWPASRIARLLVLLAAVGIVGWADYVSGPEVGMSLFYIVPVFIGAWYGGLTEAFVTGIFAAACWYRVDLALQSNEHFWISTWNGTTRLAIYLAIGVLTAIVRSDRERLSTVNARLAKALQDERSIARTDSLTELPNSRALYEKLDRLIETSRSTKEPICLALLDIDNFKKVNDFYGHTAGDDLLRRIAGEIRAAVRGEDFAARMGGDEFVILFREIDEAAETVGQRIVDCIAEIGKEFPGTDLGASVGIAVFRAAPDNRDAVILRADNAMYEAKATGRRHVVVFSDALAASQP